MTILFPESCYFHLLKITSNYRLYNHHVYLSLIFYLYSSPLLCIQNGDKFETFRLVMDIRNQSSMPISLVKETTGSVLVKMDLKSFHPNNCYITLEPKTVFVGMGNESRVLLTLKARHNNIITRIPGDLAITLVFSVRQKFERMV